MDINIFPEEETDTTYMPWTEVARYKQYCFPLYHFIFQINTVYTFGYSSLFQHILFLNSLKWALVIKNQKIGGCRKLKDVELVWLLQSGSYSSNKGELCTAAKLYSTQCP
jgi:hypothetical protein